MGVRGLTTFVEENWKNFYEIYYLHDCKLVIDGHGLMFWLAGKTEEPGVRINQEYAWFAYMVRAFFEGLHQCGVEPYVVFDGPATMEKYEKVLRTLTANVVAIEGMFHSDDEEMKQHRLLPPFSLDSITQLLVELEVPFASSVADADSELVALANLFDCPLLGADSDYYIFNLKQGYLSLLDMPVCAEEGETELCCTRYMVSKIYCKYGINQTKLPFLSILLGNDWVLSDVFNNKIHGIARSFGINKMSKTWRVEAALMWLSTRNDRDDTKIISELHASLPSTEDKADNITKIAYSVTLYRDLPDVSNLTEIFDRLTAEKFTAKVCDKPCSVEDAIRNGFVHFSAYHLVQQCFVGLPSAIVCDTRKHTPHLCAVDVRNFVYRLLLRRFCLASEGGQYQVVEEYDIDNASYKKVRGINIYTAVCPFCGERHRFEETCDNSAIPTPKTWSVLSNFLGIYHFQHSFIAFCGEKLPISQMSSNYQKRLDVVMLSTFYWFRKTSPTPGFVAALIWTLSFYVRRYIKRRGNPKSLAQKSNSQESNKPCLSKGTSANRDNSSNTVLENEQISASSSSKSVDERDTKNQTPEEMSISLRPTWMKKKIEIQKQKEALSRQTEMPSQLESSVNNTNVAPMTLSSLLNLFGPPASVASDGMFWWTLIEDFPTNMELLHSIAEWQCSLWAIFQLYQAMEFDGLHLGLHDIFGSNIVLHEIDARLARSDKMPKADRTDVMSYCNDVARWLDEIPLMKVVFLAMVEFLLQ